MEKQIISKLLNWYKFSKRDLPWRTLRKNNLPNPYYVFVSEYMLQQTTVPTVKKRFKEFIIKWPSINDLAKTNEPTILKFWSGLGYYTRARNLLKAAKIIKKNFNNHIPNKYEDLITLPGIGDYTAKAILGIGYNQSVMPLDANIERILARLFSLKQPLIKIKKKLSVQAELFRSNKFSSDLIQSFMDYGSLICTPRNPNCTTCEIKKYCLGYKQNLQNIIPIKIIKQKLKPKKYTRAYILMNERDEILVRTRPSKGMLASMLEVPNDEWVENKSLLQKDKLVKKIDKNFEKKANFSYSFSHFDLRTEIYYLKVRKDNFPRQKWLSVSRYSKSQLPTVMKKIVQLVA